ncbi:hypothetical protein [Fructobacillus ficulneus]|uniref:Uncharacterized protein n=1 Tax=Fructobacillus ficulneus TaxID=157463 RepID=A0A0K8MHZ0_9LACO|nr:hypothetical protein [Fructobacillus ficulneus]GAP00058.1 hypothetical protein FFIC_280630 [Fructobacillus ficulneus]
MFKKVRALCTFNLKVALDNKIVFLYSFVMPLAYLLFNVVSGNHHHIGTTNQLNTLIPIVAYMVVTGVLNGWVMTILVMRETNFLKTFTSIVGNKLLIFLSNFLINLCLNLLQIIAVALLYQISTSSFDLPVLALILVTAFCVDIVVSLAATVFLVAKMKQSSISMVLTTYIVLGIYLVGNQPQGLLARIGFNLVDMYSLTVDVGYLFYHLNHLTTFAVLAVILPVLLIIGIGGFLLKRVPVSSIHTRA